MEDRYIKLICLSLFLLGLLSLHLLKFIYTPHYVPLPAIDESLIGDVIRTKGAVDNYVVKNGITFFILKDRYTKIRCVAFEPLHLKKNETITVEGRVEIYKNKLEIIVERLIK